MCVPPSLAVEDTGVFGQELVLGMAEPCEAGTLLLPLAGCLAEFRGGEGEYHVQEVFRLPGDVGQEAGGEEVGRVPGEGEGEDEGGEEEQTEHDC